jgi:hypothetical protein
MNLLSVNPFDIIESLVDDSCTLVFNIEPLHGDILESVYLSEVPKDSEKWDTDTNLRSSVVLNRNDNIQLIQESPRSSTLNHFDANDLYNVGFAQSTNKKVMLTLDKTVLIPWIDLLKLKNTHNKLDLLDNSIPLHPIRFPIVNLWKAKLRLYVNVPKILVQHCHISLITVSITAPTYETCESYELKDPFVNGILLVSPEIKFYNEKEGGSR